MLKYKQSTSLDGRKCLIQNSENFAPDDRHWKNKQMWELQLKWGRKFEYEMKIVDLISEI